MANKLARFNNFGDLARFDAFRDLDDFFRNFPLGEALMSKGSAPRITMDVTENDDAYVVKAEVAGVKKEDINVTIDGNMVSIKVETKRDSEQKEGETVVRTERYYGVQSRSFSLAHDIDDDKAVANYQNGVLELTLPKKSAGGGSKTLQIS
ncbi:MAG TPA: Hsp20/alpha crystallin family protein [Pusillimonas sp.]|uniref:Hsp20/alpha crystallin family protein n=1 Tax=Pusillimonas sp. TaxID=3040095 RepID=UPI002CEF10E8|nr:Hsp20/alpha crystallin family protein [Pusillimonas sp.]HUH87012.1 Hsp20/alpha crystallin family protein [Pusillimonas sp.]